MKTLLILLAILCCFITPSWATDTKISDLPDGTGTIGATDKIPVARGAANYYVTPAAIIGTIPNVTLSANQVAGTLDGATLVGISIDNDLSSVSASDDTIPSAKATKAMGDLKMLKTQVFTACTTIKDPTATSDHQVFRAGVAITITAVHCLATGGTNIDGNLQECDANGANCAGVDGATLMSCTAGSNVNDDGALSNASIDAGDYIKWVTDHADGTQTELIVCFDYTMP